MTIYHCLATELLMKLTIWDNKIGDRTFFPASFIIKPFFFKCHNRACLLFKLYYFFWFPTTGLRPTFDCISSPRRISAVSWAHPAYIMRALPHVSLPISWRCASPHHHGFWASEPSSTARARPTLFGLNAKVVRFPIPRTPHTQTTLVSKIEARNQKTSAIN